MKIILPKFSFLLKVQKFRNTKYLPLILGVVLLLVVSLVLVFLLSPKKKTLPTVTDPTKPTELTYQGKIIGVPPKVLQITAEDLYRDLQTNYSVTVIQITTVKEWQEGHIKGSFVMPKEVFAQGPDNLNSSDNLALVSADGVDSARVAENLIYHYGFNRLKTMSLQGGLNEWKKKGYPLEK